MKNKYVPILKYKAAEIDALKQLRTEYKNNEMILPVIRLVAGNDPSKRYQELYKAIEDIKGFGNLKILFDPNDSFEVQEKAKVWRQVSQQGNTLFGNCIVPVLTFQDLQQAYPFEVIGYFQKAGIALRIEKNEISKNIWSEVLLLLNSLGIAATQVHIIIDYKETSNESVQLISQSFPENLSEWGGVTFVSGAFRENLSGLDVGTHKLPRNDWLLWQKLSLDSSGNRKELNYGDYTIQYPLFSEFPEGVIPNPSRSIRYAKETEWIIFKGQTDKAENSAKAKQYFAHIQILNKLGHLYDADCCWGDTYILNLLNNGSSDSCGSFREWITVGMNHHMSLTVQQLAYLD